MTTFAKTHPAIRNERGCAVDNLFLALLIVMSAMTIAVAITALTLLP